MSDRSIPRGEIACHRPSAMLISISSSVKRRGRGCVGVMSQLKSLSQPTSKTPISEKESFSMMVRVPIGWLRGGMDDPDAALGVTPNLSSLLCCCVIRPDRRT